MFTFVATVHQPEPKQTPFTREAQMPNCANREGGKDI